MVSIKCLEIFVFQWTLMLTYSRWVGGFCGEETSLGSAHLLADRAVVCIFSSSLKFTSGLQRQSPPFPPTVPWQRRPSQETVGVGREEFFHFTLHWVGQW